MMRNSVEIHNATVTYRTHIALHNISLSIPAGAFTAVIGPNGAGKTTLLTLINGLGNLVSGTVCVNDLPLVWANLRQIRLMCGYVPQHGDIDPRMPVSVGESIAMGRYGRRGLFRRMNKADIEHIRKTACMVGLQRLMDRPIGQVSGGERQKAALARALVQEPSILLLDEPTANLDPKARVEIMRIVGDYYQSSKSTVIMVTHSLDHVPSCCNYAVLTKNAGIVAAGGFDRICTASALSELYDCPMRVSKQGDSNLAIPDITRSDIND